ncbi:MAG: hypothetical protein ACKOC6_02655, partial [bacterium]
MAPFGGTTLFDAKLRFPGCDLAVKGGLNVGARAGWSSRSWIGLEGAAGLSGTSENGGAGRDDDWQHLSGNLVLSPA